MRSKDWNRATSASSMARLVVRKFHKRPRFSRKLRLAACACLRLVEANYSPVDVQAIGYAEAHADGLVSARRMATVRAYYKGAPDPLGTLYSVLAPDGAVHTNDRLLEVIYHTNLRGAAGAPLRPTRVRLLRDIFGDPFAPVDAHVFNSVGPQARTVADAIVQDGLLEDLPVLADALEDDGYADETVLADLRRGGPRPRGCWSLDRVRGLDLSVAEFVPSA